MWDCGTGCDTLRKPNTAYGSWLGGARLERAWVRAAGTRCSTSAIQSVAAHPSLHICGTGLPQVCHRCATFYRCPLASRSAREQDLPGRWRRWRHAYVLASPDGKLADKPLRVGRDLPPGGAVRHRECLDPRRPAVDTRGLRIESVGDDGERVPHLPPPASLVHWTVPVAACKRLRVLPPAVGRSVRT